MLTDVARGFPQRARASISQKATPTDHYLQDRHLRHSQSIFSDNEAGQSLEAGEEIGAQIPGPSNAKITTPTMKQTQLAQMSRIRLTISGFLGIDWTSPLRPRLSCIRREA